MCKRTTAFFVFASCMRYEDIRLYSFFSQLKKNLKQFGTFCENMIRFFRFFIWSNCKLEMTSRDYLKKISIKINVANDEGNTRIYNLSSGPHIIQFLPVVDKKRKNFE